MSEYDTVKRILSDIIDVRPVADGSKAIARTEITDPLDDDGEPLNNEAAGTLREINAALAPHGFEAVWDGSSNDDADGVSSSGVAIYPAG